MYSQNGVNKESSTGGCRKLTTKIAGRVNTAVRDGSTSAIFTQP
uniref:Uncharacterized protein n=1 Tax=Arundo donax TaxID=35708 RepID=A0A0A9FHP8_ARUDO